LVTFLSDFGNKSGYVAQMKGVLYSLVSPVHCVDISHEIAPQNVREGAFILRTTSQFFPRGTIHIAVVDPGVGTDRRGIVVVTKNQIFVGPDNGLLIPAARAQGDYIAYEISNQTLLRHPPSRTFHGRDIFTPIAAQILNGLPFDQIGQRVESVTDLSFSKASILDGTIFGSVLFVDGFGNIITNIHYDDVKDRIGEGQALMVQIGSKSIQLSLVVTYGKAGKDELIALFGSSGYLEISKNQGAASTDLQIKIGDLVQIRVS
jgi:S-adenosylmethionine hydrolase